MRRTAIVGTGQTKYTRRRTDVNQPELIREAAKATLDDAGIGIDQVDAIVIASGPPLFEGINHPEKWFVDACGGNLKPIVRTSGGGATGGYGVIVAHYYVASGLFDTVLAVSYDKLSEGALQYAISSLYDPLWGREFAVGIMSFAAAYSMTRIDWHTEEHAAMVSVKNHRNGFNNPYAQLPLEITVEDVLKSAPLVLPIKTLDCPPISDGACGLVIASEEKAKTITPKPAWIKGLASIAEDWNVIDRDLLAPVCTRLASKKAYEQAGITHPIGQIDVAEVYEAFSFEELVHYESLGFCAPREGGKLIEKGVTQMTGSLPVNPSGGVLCANAIGTTAMVRVIETALQVMGKAGARQVPDVKTALAHSYGGWNNHHTVVILGDRP